MIVYIYIYIHITDIDGLKIIGVVGKTCSDLRHHPRVCTSFQPRELGSRRPVDVVSASRFPGGVKGDVATTTRATRILLRCGYVLFEL